MKGKTSMQKNNIIKFLRSKTMGNVIILIASLFLIYLIISLYFINHFFFNTKINNINFSLKPYSKFEEIIKDSIETYKLEIIERSEDGNIEESKEVEESGDKNKEKRDELKEKNGVIEENSDINIKKDLKKIGGKDINIQYNKKNSMYKVYKNQNLFKWISGLFNKEEYHVDDLFVYDKENLKNKISELNCVNKEIIEPENVKFKYSDGLYEVIEEVYGNKINIEKLNEAIEISILNGNKILDLNEKNCYINPIYTLNSDKTFETKSTLNKYVKSKIVYMFGSESEILDGNLINEWLSIDENLEVVINERSVKEYVKGLSKTYNTVGITRNFKTSTGKTVDVKGGYYGWKINVENETKDLVENIKLGSLIEKEPIYTQEALYRDENDIGNTYVEINITKQHLWFYKNGKVITQGSIVTGAPNKGYDTKNGTYMLNYKEKESTLSGQNYEAKVKYWMPFNGNVGIHDASWRSSFGGQIYKRNGTHGCVNSPLYLAKTIFENIEEGTPIICYEE